MSLWKLIKRSLFFYWRTNTGVFLAAAVSTAILTGALLVGDCVEYSLGRLITERLGRIEASLNGRNRFFRKELADQLSRELQLTIAPAVNVKGVISDSTGNKRVNRVEILGVDERFYKLGSSGNTVKLDLDDGIILNEKLAKKIGAGVGDEVVLRIGKPGFLSRDLVLMPESDMWEVVRLKVKAIAAEKEFGNFGLQANQVSPYNVFVSIDWLAKKLDRDGYVNTLLVEQREEGNFSIEQADKALNKYLQIDDLGLKAKKLQREGFLEIKSKRVFIEDTLAQAVMGAEKKSIGILTYFVNELVSSEQVTPYSFVTAMSYIGNQSLIPEDLRDDEIIISSWLAKDLNVGKTNSIELSYYVEGDNGKLVEDKSSFKVRDIVSIDKIDRELMPEFPGLADVENCRDWKPGVPIELSRIRKKDEDYWNKYRGTPKAFVTLKAGQRMWGNRFGKLTAVRYRLAEGVEEKITSKILGRVKGSSTGLFFEPVRERSIKAWREATDFGELFLGLSFFVIAAAVILSGLVFVFGVEKRTEQTGMLMAVGFSPKLLKGLYLIEGLIISAAGAILGAVGGMLYTKGMIYGLGTFWQEAVTSTAIEFYAKPATLFTGALWAVAISLVTIWLTLHSQLRNSARELLSGLKWQFFVTREGLKRKFRLLTGVIIIIFAVVLLLVSRGGDSGELAAAFFGAGALFLIAEVILCYWFLGQVESRYRGVVRKISGLGLRNSTRRKGRSVAVTGLLAAGVFVIIAVGANRGDILEEANRRESGTGGFSLMGESAIGIGLDLNSHKEQNKLGIDRVKFLGLKVYDGDDASCFNLNRAQRPGLLGVDEQELLQRGAFSFVKVLEGFNKKQGWQILRTKSSDSIVGAVGDEATIRWALGKKVGDHIEYVDESGNRFQVKIAGMLKNSILQGRLVISEKDFVKHFPSEEGHRMYLMDVENEAKVQTAEKLSLGLRDYGFDVVTTKEKLLSFKAVENSYLAMFQLLGGLGLILGSIGLGLVVLRNVLDRRGEFAMMQALGFEKKKLKQMVLFEHVGLLAAGLIGGTIAGFVSVFPVIRTSAEEVPYMSLILTITAIGISGIIWIWIAAVMALSGKALDALRNE